MVRRGMPQLEQHLLEFDGKAISLLSEARVLCRDRPGYIADLMQFCTDPRAHVADGAAWIVKAEIDDGARLDSVALDPLVQHLGAVPSWQAQLCLCQAVSGFDLTADQAALFYAWADTLADHDRPFLRAWSLHARVTISQKHPDFRAQAKAALNAADQDKAASVRARARNLRKGLSW